MLEDPHQLVFVVGALVLALLGYARLRADKVWFDIEADQSQIWNPLRRWILTPVHRYTESIPGFYTKTRVNESEYIDTVDGTTEDVLEEFAALKQDGITYTRQPLASIAEDWTGELESASIACFYGPKFGSAVLPNTIVEALPEWLRKYQAHVRTFPRPPADGTARTARTAHSEKNPWYPTNWIGHLLSSGFDPEKGVRIVASHLTVEPEAAPREEPAS